MFCKLLCIGAVAALVLGCDELPTAPDAPRAPPSVSLSTDVLAAMHTLLDDPLVGAIVARADHSSTDQTVQRTMQAVADGILVGDATAIRRALRTAHRALQEAGDVEAAVHRAALGLTLDAVSQVLDSASRATTDEGNALPLDLRGGHDD